MPAVGVTHSTIPLDGALAMADAELGDKDSMFEFLAQRMRFDLQLVSLLGLVGLSRIVMRALTSLCGVRADTDC